MFFDQAVGPRPLWRVQPIQTVLIVMAALFAIRLLAIFLVPFTDTTEARYAEIARKMVETGDWITPQFAYGVPFWGKPPLHTWLSAAGMEIFGVSPFGARIFIFLTALGLLWLFWRFLQHHASAQIALLSTLVLASSGLFFGAAAFVMTDMVMTLGTTLSMLAYWNFATSWPSDPTRQRDGGLIFVGIAIGLLAKGPVAVVLVMIPLGLMAVSASHRRHLRALPWARGLLICLLMAAPWYILAEWKTPGFLSYFLIGEHFERFIIPDWQGDLYGSGHERAKGAIWGGWIVGFFPWSFLMMYMLLRPRRVLNAFRADRSAILIYLLCWAVSPLLLFTLSANILTAYVLPGLPASAALLVLLWKDICAPDGENEIPPVFLWSASIPLLAFLLITIFGALVPTAAGLRTQRPMIEAAHNLRAAQAPSYLGTVPFSAQFYTAGRARALASVEDIDHLMTNATPDILILSEAQASALDHRLPPTLHREQTIGGFVIFAERAQTGDQQ